MTATAAGDPVARARRFGERRAHWIAGAIALVAGLMTMTSDPIGVFYDDGIYLLTAKALAEGLGYVYPQLPGHPPAIHYPPAWPALLALVWRFGPEFPANIGWLKLLNPAIMAAAAAGAVLLGRRLFGLPWWAALGVTVLAVVSVPVLLLTNMLLSEPLFLALLLPTLLVTERLVKEGGVRLAVGAAVLMALLVLVRTLGGTVFIAALMLLAYERRWRELGAYLGVTVLLLAPWQWYVWQSSVGFPDELRGSYGPYLEWVADGYRAGGLPFLAEVVRKNIVATWMMLGVFFSPLVGGVVRAVFAGLAVVALMGGLLALWSTGRARVTALGFAGYLAVVIAWPFWVDRFLWVMWPPLLLIAAAGVQAAWARRGAGTARQRLARSAAAGAALLVAGHAIYNARGLAQDWDSRASADMTAAGVRIIRQVNDDRRLDGKLLVTELAPMVALYTGQQVLPVEILTPREHIVDKGLEDRIAELERIDRRFLPEAYVVMHAGHFYEALRQAKLGHDRILVDVSPPGTPVRTIMVNTR